MDIHLKEKLVYDIIVGIHYFTFDHQEYRIVPNNKFDIYHANHLYHECVSKGRFDNFMSATERTAYLNYYGIWTYKNEEDLKTLEKNLQDMKLDLYKNRINISYVNGLRKRIQSLKNGINKSYMNKNKLFEETLEYHATQLKNDFLLCMSIRNDKGKKICNKSNYLSVDYRLITEARKVLDQNFITASQYREIARTEPFRSMWINAKYRTFNRNIAELTYPQKILCSFSRMYDSVYKNTECPSDDVIQDDDMLDGWFIQQTKEQEERQKEKLSEDKLSHLKHGNGQELFLVSNNQKDAESIYNMNNHQGRNIIKSRNKQIEAENVVKHQNLKDVRMDLHLQATQESRESMRNKRR